MELHQAPTSADRFQERTGINIETGHRFSRRGSVRDGEPTQGPPLVLATRPFRSGASRGFAREEGGVVEDYKGIRLIPTRRIWRGVRRARPCRAWWRQPPCAGRSTPSSLARNVTGNDEVMRLVRESTMAMSGVSPDWMRWPVSDSRRSADRLPAINWVSAKGLVNGGIEGQLRARRVTRSRARTCQVVQGFVALGRMQAGPNHPEIAAFLDSLQLTGQGKTVSLGFSVPPAMIDALGALRARRPARGRRRPRRPPRSRPARPRCIGASPACKCRPPGA